MLMRNKKGTTESMTEGIGGMLIGVIVVMVLLFVGAQFWGLFFGSGGIDNTSMNAFEGISSGILTVFGNQDSSEKVPFQVDGDYTLVAFSIFSDQSSMNCKSPKALRPSRNCDGACLCICENEFDEKMCLSQNAKCFSFANLGPDNNLEFDVSCEGFEGEGEPQMMSIENKNGKISLNV